MSQSFGELAVSPAQRAITDLYGQIVGLACGGEGPRSVNLSSVSRSPLTAGQVRSTEFLASPMSHDGRAINANEATRVDRRTRIRAALP